MSSISPKDRIIFALDVSSVNEAARFTALLKDHVGMFKVGLELFVAAGPAIIKAVRENGGRGIFLDLKFHDIPETVKGAMRSASTLGADLVTVHTSDGQAMMKAAVEAAGASRVLGVTVLTSLSADAFPEAGIDKNFTPASLVLHRAKSAKEAGCAGIVCSGQEARAIRDEYGPDFLIVTPGVRLADDAIGDQKRVVTPFEAVKNGADYIVVGRPIRKAADPIEAAKRIAGEIEKAVR
ncbi:MAG: orotidine-5'-phosphate decarboxylase [Deltaproteobacteria bacterium]|nr:orotidine-5'-phosphate decarboxylase [Deltaproteobacteria bacterium]